jgi:hypothetical protein
MTCSNPWARSWSLSEVSFETLTQPVQPTAFGFERQTIYDAAR